MNIKKKKKIACISTPRAYLIGSFSTSPTNLKGGKTHFYFNVISDSETAYGSHVRYEVLLKPLESCPASFSW